MPFNLVSSMTLPHPLRPLKGQKNPNRFLCCLLVPDKPQQDVGPELDPKQPQQSCSKKYPAIIKLNHSMFTVKTVIIGFVFM